jgi:hypothetical protein
MSVSEYGREPPLPHCEVCQLPGHVHILAVVVVALVVVVGVVLTAVGGRYAPAVRGSAGSMGRRAFLCADRKGLAGITGRNDCLGRSIGGS